MIDESRIRRLLATHEFDVEGTKYGVVLWRIVTAAPGDGAGPILRLDMTAAPTTPSNELRRFTIELARDLVLDPATLLGAIAAQLPTLMRVRV